MTLPLLKGAGFHLTPVKMNSKCSGLRWGISYSSSYAAILHSIRLERVSFMEMGESLISEDVTFLFISQLEMMRLFDYVVYFDSLLAILILFVYTIATLWSTIARMVDF